MYRYLFIRHDVNKYSVFYFIFYVLSCIELTILSESKIPIMLQENISPVPDVAPLNPVAGLFETNIYERINNHPITSLNHTHHNITTVVDLYTNNISPRFKADTQLAKALFAGFTAALGQARLKYGESVAGDLPQPITINCVSTNGAE